MEKLVTVAEIDPFDATARRAGLTEDERTELVDFLAANPEKGDLMPGTGGLRKLRWRKGGRGKRSGYRAIYYFFSDDMPIYLMAIYAKNQRTDLSPEQRRQLSALAEDLKASARAAMAKRSIR
ncbi:MAG: type II toxin-antitoxin system RelE/ParE family toxin [Stellaceae bacterium]